MIENVRKNIMGTVSFDGKFDGMRKAQDFVVYPIGKGVEPATISVQSDNRFGKIDMATGAVVMSKPANYANSMTLAMTGANAGKLNAEELLMLKGQIMATASAKAGSNGVVYCDNSGAAEIFGEGNATD